jgi:hypothetical protein
MPSIALESPSVVQFFNMFEQKKPVHAKKKPASTNNTPNRSTTYNHHHRKNSKPSRASSVSPKPNKKLPNTPKTKKSVHQEQAKPGSQPTGRYPAGSGSRRNTGEFKNLQKPSNCPKNNNNHHHNNENQSDSSLSVKSSKPSNINGYVKLAKLTNKSDSDNDSPGNSNASHRSSQRMRYRNEDSFCFEVQANSEHYAGSAEAPDAKSLPLPPTDWIETKRSNRVPKNTFTANSKKIINNSNSKDHKDDLTPNVQHLFASMGMVKASA